MHEFQPNEVDALLHDKNTDLIAWLETIADGPQRQIRALQVAIALDDQPSIMALLAALPDVAPARGLRALAWSALSVWEQVLEHPPLPTGHTPLEMECAVHGYTARGIALTETGQFDEAVTAVQIAEVLARMAGMSQRAQMLGLELDRVMTLAGHAVPERTQERLYSVMPHLRRQWGMRNLAESHMALGCFGKALFSLGHQSTDGPDDAALREFLHTVLKLPPARPDDDELLGADHHYVRLARAGRDTAVHSRFIDLDGIMGEPQATYAVLMKGSIMLRLPGMLQAAADLLSSIKPLQADQAYFRVMCLLTCYVSGANVADPHLLLSQINVAIDRFRPDADVLSVVHWFVPESTALLTLVGPEIGAHPRLRNLDLVHVPVLAGKVVRYRGLDYTTYGKVGRVEVLEALGIPQAVPFPEELKRNRAALSELPASRVNLGWVARGCLRMRRAAQKGIDPRMAHNWKTAYVRVLEEMLTPDVQKEILSLPEFHPNTLR